MRFEKRKTVLITGGAGFIGSHLADKLLSQGYAVTVLDNLSNGSLDNLQQAFRHENFSFVEGDILTAATCAEAVRETAYVFHLACLGVRHSIHSPFENHRVNAEGTLNLLEQAKQAGVRHFFYISTSEVYGSTTSFPITEAAPTHPLTVYGASKLAGEHYSRAFHACYGLPTTVLRIFNNYGPRAHYEGDAGEIIPRSIVRILHGRQPVVFGNGNITRDFFFVKDTAAALSRFLDIAQSAQQDKITGQTFNIGTGVELKMKDVLERLLAMMGKEELGIRYLPDRPADVPRLWVNAGAFQALTGFKAAYTFEEGLQETVRYYEQKVTERNMLDEIKIKNWVK